MPFLVDYDALVLEWSSSERPALAVLGTNLVLAWRSDSSHRIHVSFSRNGRQWTRPQKMRRTCSGAPALATFQGGLPHPRLFLAWKADDATNRLHLTSTENLIAWTNPDKLAFKSRSSPALAAFAGRLYLAWRADDPSNRMHFARSADPTAAGGGWDSYRRSMRTASSPSLATITDDSGTVGDRLFLAYRTAGGTDRLAVTYSPNGLWWPTSHKLDERPTADEARYLYDVPRRLSASPALLGYVAGDVGDGGDGGPANPNPGALLVWSGHDRSRRLNYATSPDDPLSPRYNDWSDTAKLRRFSPNAAALAKLGNDVYLAWTGNDRSRRIHLVRSRLISTAAGAEAERVGI